MRSGIRPRWQRTVRGVLEWWSLEILAAVGLLLVALVVGVWGYWFWWPFVVLAGLVTLYIVWAYVRKWTENEGILRRVEQMEKLREAAEAAEAAKAARSELE